MRHIPPGVRRMSLCGCMVKAIYISGFVLWKPHVSFLIAKLSIREPGSSSVQYTLPDFCNLVKFDNHTRTTRNGHINLHCAWYKYKPDSIQRSRYSVLNNCMSCSNLLKVKSYTHIIVPVGEETLAFHAVCDVTPRVPCSIDSTSGWWNRLLLSALLFWALAGTCWKTKEGQSRTSSVMLISRNRNALESHYEDVFKGQPILA